MFRWKAAIACAGLLASAGAAAQTPAISPPDAIYINGNVLTVDEASSTQEGFAVSGDRFVAVGGSDEMRALAGGSTKIVDLGGATVVPGMSDNHDHLYNSGKYLHRGVDMVGVTSLEEMERRLRAAVAAAKPGEVVFTTTGWTPQPAPTRALLDAISAEVPIVLIAMRRGNALYNSAALRRLGVSRENPNFMGAHMPVDDAGEPTGANPHFPQSVQMIDMLIPPLTEAEEEAMIVAEMQRRNALGITAIRELSVWPEGVRAFQRLREREALTLRISLGVSFPDEENAASHLAALPRPTRDDLWLFTDTQGEEPWTPVHIPPEDYTALARAMHDLNWRPSPHVSSDAATGSDADEATENTLAAYEAIDRESGIRDRRWIVEHVALATPEQIERMARLGLIVSTQDHGYRTTPPAPAERLANYNPTRSFIESGLIVAAGSDTTGPSAAQMAPNNPMIPFTFYVTRRSLAGEVTTPSQQVSRADALRTITANGAYAAFQEQDRGSIEPGKLADFVILDRDLMTVPDDQLLATRPLATFVGGNKVYAAPQSPF